MKAHCMKQGYKEIISDTKEYIKLKHCKADWPQNIKDNLKTVEIPYELFLHFLNVDRKASSSKCSTCKWLFLHSDDERCQGCLGGDRYEAGIKGDFITIMEADLKAIVDEEKFEKFKETLNYDKN